MTVKPYNRKTSSVISIRLDQRLNTILGRQAEEHGVAASTWARRLIRKALAAEPGEVEEREEIKGVDDENEWS